MRLVGFIVFLVLYFYDLNEVKSQSTDNPLVIEYSTADFLIERPFTISLIIRDSDTRPSVTFPDVPGLTKQGIDVSSTRSESSGQEVVSQVIRQTYVALRTGTIRVPPFVLSANGQSVRSPGITLTVRSLVTPAAAAAAAALAKAKNDKLAAFLQTTVDKTNPYIGEALRVRLSFFVAENYPYEVEFQQLEQQVATIVRQLRPVNAWEENDNISELTRRPAVINGRNYAEYRIYQSTFFLLATRTGTARQINLPALPLTVTRRVIGAPAAPISATALADPPTAPKAETVTFTSQPVSIRVRPLPTAARQSGTLVNTAATNQMSVGTFRLTTDIDRTRVAVGQSVRFDIRIEGRGNITSIQPPQVVASAPDIDVFPPQIEEQVGRDDEQVSGSKWFRYFLVPKQKGTLSLDERFFWVYFNPQSGRYDTLRPRAVLRVGQASDSLTTGVVPSDTLDGTGRPSIYAGLEQADSTTSTVNWPVLVRSIANVLIVLMILGTLFVFTRK